MLGGHSNPSNRKKTGGAEMRALSPAALASAVVLLVVGGRGGVAASDTREVCNAFPCLAYYPLDGDVKDA